MRIPKRSLLSLLFGERHHIGSAFSSEPASNCILWSRPRPAIKSERLDTNREYRSYSPDLLESSVVLQRDDVVGKGYKLEVVRRYCYVA